MRRVLAGSWERLNAEERRGLARLSVFRGGFSFGAAKVAAKLSPNVLLTLLRRSLVYRGDDGRFSLHEVVRHYAAEQLQETGSPERVQTEHARYYLGLQGGLEMWSDKEPASLATLDAELPNVRAAWEYAVGGGKLPEFWRPNDVVIFFDRRMRYAEGLELLTAASGCFNPADEAHREALAALAVDRAWLLFRLGRYAEAEALAQAALDGSRDKKLRMKALNTLGIVARQQGDYPKAAERLEGALALAQELGDTVRVAAYSNNLGGIYLLLADYTRAEKAVRAALTLHQAATDTYGEAVTMIDLSSIYMQRGAYEHALEIAESSLTLAYERNFSDLIPLGLLNRAFALFRLGRLAQAEVVYREVLEMVNSAGHTWEQATALTLLGRIATRRGQAAQARHLLTKGFLLAWRHQNMPEILDSLVAISELEYAKGAYDRAFQLLSAVITHPSTPPITHRDAEALVKKVSDQLPCRPSFTVAPMGGWLPALMGLEDEVSST